MLQFLIRFDLILWEHELHLNSIGRFPLGRVIGVIYSTYDRATRNKIWGISCNVSVPYNALKEYSWSKSIIKLRQDFSFKCSKNGVLVGIDSYPEEGGDWQHFFECANINKEEKECFLSGYTCTEKHWVKVTSSNYYMVRIESHYDHEKE